MTPFNKLNDTVTAAIVDVLYYTLCISMLMYIQPICIQPHMYKHDQLSGSQYYCKAQIISQRVHIISLSELNHIGMINKYGSSYIATKFKLHPYTEGYCQPATLTFVSSRHANVFRLAVHVKQFKIFYSFCCTYNLCSYNQPYY